MSNDPAQTSPSPETTPPRRSGRRIIVEAASIGFAVLLAVFAEGFRERLNERDFARRATQAIVAEIEDNRAEIVSALDSIPATIDQLRENIRVLESEDDLSGLELNSSFSVLNDGAWEAAKVSGTTAHFPLERTIAFSSAYRTQEIFDEVQRDILYGFSITDSKVVGGEGVAHFRELRGLYGILLQLGDGLLAGYDEALAAVEDGG